MSASDAHKAQTVSKKSNASTASSVSDARQSIQDNLSYRDVLRNRRVAGLLLGDLLANVGTGMIIVAMPVQTLSIHGGVPKAICFRLRR